MRSTALFQVELEVQSRRGRCDRGVRHDSLARARRRVRRAATSLPKQTDLRGRTRHGRRLGRSWTGPAPRVWLEPVPAHVVPAIETIGFERRHSGGRRLKLETSRQNRQCARAEVLTSLDAFVDAFASWVSTQQERVDSFGPDAPVAARIVDRSEVLSDRMRKAVDLLRDEDQGQLRTAFALAMEAMRLQMRRSSRRASRAGVHSSSASCWSRSPRRSTRTTTTASSSTSSGSRPAAARLRHTSGWRRSRSSAADWRTAPAAAARPSSPATRFVC